MLKKYKLSFEICGVLLFLIVMIPNFIWFAIPAPNDILRAKSITETVDTVASVCQILMIVSICIFRNRESKKLCISPFVIMVTVCYLLYVASWIAYYNGMTNASVDFNWFICSYQLFSYEQKREINFHLWGMM